MIKYLEFNDENLKLSGLKPKYKVNDIVKITEHTWLRNKLPKRRKYIIKDLVICHTGMIISNDRFYIAYECYEYINKEIKKLPFCFHEEQIELI